MAAVCEIVKFADAFVAAIVDAIAVVVGAGVKVRFDEFDATGFAGLTPFDQQRRYFPPAAVTITGAGAKKELLPMKVVFRYAVFAEVPDEVVSSKVAANGNRGTSGTRPWPHVSLTIKRLESDKSNPVMPSILQLEPLMQVLACIIGEGPITEKLPMSTCRFEDTPQKKSVPEHQHKRY
jgi:hypothetical protein